jgi:hypothetical protein
MQEVSFSIPVSGTVKIDEGFISITVNRAETTISFEPEKDMVGRLSLGKGRTLYDVILETAIEVVKGSAMRTFSAAELYNNALKKYPKLRRNTWNAHMIASAPNHPSHKHHSSNRDYFRFAGDGQYRLDPKYIPDSNLSEIK